MILTALLVWYWNVSFNLWAFHFLAFASFIKTNFYFLWRKNRRRQSKSRQAVLEIEIQIKPRKRNARRKQVRKISFPLNDEESRSSSQRALFPIYSYPLHRWLKLAAKHTAVRWRHGLVPSFLRSFHAPSSLHDCRLRRLVWWSKFLRHLS